MRTRALSMLVLLLAAVGLLVSLTAARSGLAAGPPSRPAPPAAPAPEAPAAELDPNGELPRAVGRFDATVLEEVTRRQWVPRPVRVRLDSIGIDAGVRPVGVQADSQMRLPDDPRVLGWYRFGAAPGTGGATVLAGHLDSQRFGVGPLVRLRDVRVGDTFGVTLTDGTTAQYVVDQVSRYERQGLPDELFTRTGPGRLHLITCGGAYDRDNGGYQQNLVVTGVPVT